MYIISKIVDGDGFFVKNLLKIEEFEVRLLGIDAPEIKKCRKLLQDEKELHLPGQLLMKLGQQSFAYLRALAKVGESVRIVSEIGNEIDVYGRVLAYAYLSDGTCINQKLIEDGYAKPFNEYYCRELSNYQLMNMTARIEGKGLYSQINRF